MEFRSGHGLQATGCVPLKFIVTPNPQCSYMWSMKMKLDEIIKVGPQSSRIAFLMT